MSVLPGLSRPVIPVLFKAACPQCRARFELGAAALRLAIGASRRTTFYSFTCPECGSAVRKPMRRAHHRTAHRRRCPHPPPPLHRLGSASMFWPMTAIALGFLGIAVLGVLAVKVFVEAQRLGRQVAATTSKINRAAEDLERAAVDLAAAGETLR